ncbi:MAG: regulatory protein RecX [Bacillota bacterium]
MAYSEQFEKARKAAYKLLNYRARTEYELTEKLLRKGFDGETVRQVINNLREYRLLDDQAYAESFVSRRPFRPQAVMAGELRNLGVNEYIINKVLVDVDSGAEFRIALAQAMSRKKRRSVDYPLESIAAFLRRRGFSQEVVDRVCDYLQNMGNPRDLDS